MAVLGRREVTCPSCFEVFVITVAIQAADGEREGTVLHLDDTDIRAHLLMHELCMCAWKVAEHKTLGLLLDRKVTRELDGRCPIHNAESAS